MNVTIELSDDNAAALACQARAAKMPTERYLADIIEGTLQRRRRRAVDRLERHLDAMASQMIPETTTEDMEAALDEALVHVRPRRIWRS